MVFILLSFPLIQELRGTTGRDVKTPSELSAGYRRLSDEDRLRLQKTAGDADKAREEGNPRPLGGRSAGARLPLVDGDVHAEPLPHLGGGVLVALPSDANQTLQEHRLRRRRAGMLQKVKTEAKINKYKEAEVSKDGPIARTLQVYGAAAGKDPLMHRDASATSTWNASDVPMGIDIGHCRARLNGWSETIQTIVSLKSRGSRTTGKLQSTLRHILRTWSASIHHRAMDGVTEKCSTNKEEARKALPSRRYVSLPPSWPQSDDFFLSKFHSIVKATHKDDTTSRLSKSETVFLLIGRAITRDAHGNFRPHEAGHRPDVCRWFLLAHLLHKPWEPMYVEMHDRGGDLRTTINEEQVDGIVRLQAPEGSMELFLQDEYFDEYELSLAIEMPYAWTTVVYKLVWSERLVDDPTANRIEVEPVDRIVHAVYDPRRGKREAAVVYEDAWASEAIEDEPVHIEDPDPARESSDDTLSSKSLFCPTEPSDDDWREHPVENPKTPIFVPDDDVSNRSDNDTSSRRSSTSSSTSSHTSRSDTDESLSASALGLGTALIKVKVPGRGFIAFYADPSGGYFVARCACRDHKDSPLECRISRTSVGGKKGARTALGLSHGMALFVL